MSSGQGCLKCGVPVVPGYVKCPRCHAVLPGSGRFRRTSIDPGGTALEERSFPIVPVAIGAAVLGVVALIAFSGGGDDKKRPAATATPTELAAPANAAPVPVAEPRAPEIPAAAPSVPAAGPDPRVPAAELERALGRQRLWSSVEASGGRVDVRSGACAEPGMGPTIDAARAALRGAGLTRLRCLAQSGAVVFERDL